MEITTPIRPNLSGDNWAERICNELQEGAVIRLAMVDACAGAIAASAEVIVRCYRRGGKVLFCGNGGSAADAQHLAAEFLGRYLVDRPPLPALALHTDTSALTAIGNDYGFEHVFIRQVQAWICPSDVIVGLSTSGASANVVAALREARRSGATTIAFVGAGGGTVAEHADIVLRVPSTCTPRIQEAHITAGHIVCGLVEAALFPNRNSAAPGAGLSVAGLS